MIVLGVVAVVAVLAAVVALAQMNKGFTVAIDKAGKFDITVDSGSDLREILIAALESDRDSVDEVLAGRGYYHFTDPDLANALEGLSPDAPEHKPAVASLRRLLRDERGPFVMPDTLVGFDDKLIDAFGRLEAKLDETKQTSALLVELWRQSLEYKGIFRTRMFEARVRRLPVRLADGSGEVLILGCPGSDFNGKRISLVSPDTTSSLAGFIGTSASHRCQEKDQKLADLFQQEAAFFGLDPVSYQRLFSPGDPEAVLEPEMAAQFQFLPTVSVAR